MSILSLSKSSLFEALLISRMRKVLFVEPEAEIRFPPGSAEYETERYLTQSFGFPAFRAYLGLSTTTAHHADLRNLATLMGRASRTPGHVRTLVLEARQERLNTGLADQKKKRGTLAADLKVVCGWLGREVMMKQWRKRGQREAAVAVREGAPKDAVRPVEAPDVSTYTVLPSYPTES